MTKSCGGGSSEVPAPFQKYRPGCRPRRFPRVPTRHAHVFASRLLASVRQYAISVLLRQRDRRQARSPLVLSDLFRSWDFRGDHLVFPGPGAGGRGIRRDHGAHRRLSRPYPLNEVAIWDLWYMRLTGDLLRIPSWMFIAAYMALDLTACTPSTPAWDTSLTSPAKSPGLASRRRSS